MTFHKWMVGFCLTLIMVAALGVNALLFSARSFQDNLQTLAPNTNGVLNLALLQRVETEIAASSAQVDGVRGRVIDLEREAKELQASSDRARGESAQLVGLVSANLAKFEEKLSITPPETASGPKGGELAQRLREVAGAASLSDGEREQVGQLIAATLRIDALEAEADRAGALATARTLEAENVGRALADADRAALGMKAQFLGESPASYATALSSGGPDSFSIIRNEANALLNSSPFGVTANLAQVHPQFLSILLVLLMGVLGGVLYLFPAYMSRQNPVTFAEIAVRIIFGMCTAIAFYIVMNAAVAGFSLTPQPQGASGATAALNPFSVSLVGILAGVLADDIARYIHRRGSELLGGRPGDPLPASDPAASDTNAPTGAGAQGPGAAAGY